MPDPINGRPVTPHQLRAVASTALKATVADRIIAENIANAESTPMSAGRSLYIVT